MEEKTYKITTGVLTEEKLRPINKYLEDETVTDIDWNGYALWIRDVNNMKIKITDNPDITPEYISTFTQHIANLALTEFNNDTPILEAETENLRITAVHETLAKSGRSLFIRKTTNHIRLTYSNMVNIYCSKPILNLLINIATAKLNIIIGGEPGVGKTELAKFFSVFIPDTERVVTIEDTREWHYNSLKPEADGVELQISNDIDYATLIKTSMRLNPNRLMLAEVRSVEAKSLFDAWSTGVKGMTTLHVDTVMDIPDRILNMMGLKNTVYSENNVFDYLDVGILVKAKKNDNGENYRCIDEVAFFYREGRKKVMCLIVENGILTGKEIPECKIKKLKEAGIMEPYCLGKEIKEKMKKYEIQ